MGAPPLQLARCGVSKKRTNNTFTKIPCLSKQDSVCIMQVPEFYHTLETSFFIYPSSTPLSFRLLNKSGSRNFEIVTSSARPFLLLVFSTKSLASACAVAGSRGRSLISLSSGSPGTIDQRSKTRDTEAWPWVWIWQILVH